LHATRISGNTVMKFNKNGNSVRHGTLAIPGHKFSIRKMLTWQNGNGYLPSQERDNTTALYIVFIF
jgi:hypothetical protein